MTALTRSLALLALCVSLGVGTASATTITIDDGSSVGGSLGDYYVVAPGSGESSPGQVVEVLKQDDNPVDSNSIEMSVLYDYLSGLTPPVDSANKLLFGLGVNEPNATDGTEYVDVTALTMTFELPGGGSQVFNLGAGNTIHIKDWVNGASAGDALIGIDLGFDFMSTYSSTSTEKFTISSTLANYAGGFEIYFLDSGLYDLTNGGGGGLSPVPEPASLALFGTGLAFVATQVRRRRNNSLKK